MPSSVAMIALAAAGSRRPPLVNGTVQSGDIAAATLTSTITFPTLARPWGVGDVLYLAAGMISTDTVATPSGWTLVFGPVVDSTSGIRGYLWRRAYDGTEGGAVTLTKTGTGGNWRGSLIGVTNTAGHDVSATGASNPADTHPIIPTVTPTVANSTELGLIMVRTGSPTVTWPTHFASLVNHTGAGVPSIHWGRYAPVPASAMGTFQATINSSLRWIAAAVVVKHI